MSYVTMALWAEGKSDHGLLRPILRRLVAEHADDVAEDFISLPDPQPAASGAERIKSAVSRRKGKISLLFIHSDGAGQPERVRRTNVQPAVNLISALQSPPRCVAVVPRHETEAWALADRSALADALGVDIAAIRDFPPIDEVERLADPKARLASIRSSVRRGRRRLPDLDLRQIGESVRLECLRKLAAFRACEDGLISAMRDRRFC